MGDEGTWFNRNGDLVMDLKPRDMDTLIDLVENKLSDILVWDGDDRKEVASLKRCLQGLYDAKDRFGAVVRLDPGRAAKASAGALQVGH